MRILVTGGRQHAMTRRDFDFLECCVDLLRVKELVTGGAPGVELAAEAWARRRGIAVRRIQSEGSAPLVRLADALVVFPGEGCAETVAAAKRQSKPVLESPSRRLATAPAERPLISARLGPRPSA